MFEKVSVLRLFKNFLRRFSFVNLLFYICVLFSDFRVAAISHASSFVAPSQLYGGSEDLHVFSSGAYQEGRDSHA